jgi:acetate---CoA ligase (ADP-forming)
MMDETKEAPYKAQGTPDNDNAAVDQNKADAALLESFHYIFHPRSVAVIGASKKRGSVGFFALQTLVKNGFEGKIYPVNPGADTLMYINAYSSVTKIPDEVDMAIIIVPTIMVNQVAEECGRKGVHCLVVFSDGFKETGPKGALLEKELGLIGNKYGMRIIGPNCMGVINPDPAVSLFASFHTIYPPYGNMAIISQSGALGITMLEYAKNMEIGVSKFVSVGNAVDVKVGDILKYLENDEKTRVIIAYMESFDKPEELAAAARQVSLKKPIIAVKSGRTQSGLRAASSHTGALASREVASDAFFHKTGIIRHQTFQGILYTGLLMSNQPIPRGRRLAIVTHAGGAGTLAADLAEQLGLTIAELSEETKNKIRPLISRNLTLNNPLDLTGGVAQEEFANVASVLAEDPDNDAILCIWGPALIITEESIEYIFNRIGPICRKNGKTLLGCYMVSGSPERIKVGKSSKVPVFYFPETAVNALARACEYADTVKRLQSSKVPELNGIDRQRARKVIENAMTKSRESPFWLSSDDINDLLDCYSIRQARTLLAHSAEEAAVLAAKTGFPVAVKISSSTISHKSDIGGVILDCKTGEEVKKGYQAIKTKLKSLGREKEMEGVTVQHFVQGGIDTIVGMVQDALGPLVMFGLGGVFTEVLQETVFRLNPLTDVDVKEMVGSPKMARLFNGFRNIPASDSASLEDLLLRISALIKDTPEISELDLNPVKVMPKGEGYWVVDARMRIK